ncbi:hypothetical protein [Calothrix sp. PCC 6303]|uniref:hypothetical protein n=1 Tax=Calothrix sp. PCC 6303 TaxID=1170562 RepID=UPI0002A04D77|nr:hypothetical protein [Calothrix sp. PCC 6303]AFY99506.1 hypothetical protein Cal6303_0429 [Calothrix sp. PCC 6303]
MLEYPSISKRKPEFPEYLNFQTLREIGIKHLQALSGKLWTDYNLHDPGVTILEVLCYAVTDLGYRNNLDIADLLALNPTDSQQKENNFFTPDEILTCNPVTVLDVRKRLIDISGVRNAWLEKVTEKVTTYHPPIYIDYVNSKLLQHPPNDQTSENAPCLHPRGLYTVYIDLDLASRKNACGQISRSWSDILDEVKAVLCSYRNLCEDVYDIVVLGEEEIGLCSDIELEADADAEDVLVEIYVILQSLLSPRLTFYTLQELLDKGKSTSEIFAGRPSIAEDSYESHGFIDTDELAALTQQTVIYTSDLYQEILKIPGVAAIRKLSIANYINGLAQSQSSWHLQLTKGYSPVLGIERSKITLFKGLLPIPAEANEVKRRYYEQQAAHIKVIRKDNDLDLSIPQGSYYDLADHYSIQHDFPLTYGISEDGLPESAELLRKAQARQLKGYLVFFDQLLANYLAQLAHVRDLFSWEVDELQTQQNVQVNRQPEKWDTYFTQLLDFPQFEQIMDFPGLEEILKNPELDINNPKSEEIVPALGKYREFLNSINEEPETYSDRRNRFLDHLLGRFAESFADYVLLNYRMVEGHQDKVKDEIKIIHDKAQFLQDYPTLSRDRFRAFNYYNYQQVWNTENVSGFQKRVSRLLGFEDVRRRNLCHYQVDQEPGKFIFTCHVGEQSLTSKQTYLSRKDAQADLEKFLLFALHRNFYKGLTYSYFYHYGWEVEVVDEDDTIIARYEPYYLSQAERITALNILSEKLSSLFNVTEQDNGEESIATSSISQVNIIQIKQIAEENLYYFQLEIPSETSELIKFQGIQRYFSAALAQKAAIALLKQIANKQNYRPILFRQDNNSAERETAIPSSETRFTHYGYALIDQQGKVLAASSDTPTLREANATESFHERFPSQTKRDIELQRWFSNIQLNHNQFQFTVEKVNESYLFTVRHNTRNLIILQSCQSQTTELLAWQSAANFAENLRYLNRYVSPVKDQAGNSYSLGIVDQSGTLQAIAPTETNAFTTFKLLNSLEPFLQIERVTGESTGYRFRLVDLDGGILLQSTQLFSNRSIARDRSYQDVLGVLFEPGAIEPTTTQEGFGFRVLSKPREQQSAAATSPQLYSSESERDGAIEHLFLLVRASRLINIIPEPGSIPFWLIYFLKLTLQLRVDNFTQYALIKLASSPDPNYILELASSPNPTYIGRVYDQNHNILLELTQHYPTPEAAWKQGNICMELVAMTPDTQNFRLIDAELGNNGDDSQPNQSPTELYGWELTNRGKDEILATHYYNSQEERNQSIQTLQQLVNDEGFHLLEHILLRPQTASDNFLPICVNGDDATNKMGEATPLTYQDPYSFWITVILPYWSERFRNIDFRRFVERTLRLEAPAHIALKIAWVNVQQMHEFEVAYHDWLEQLAFDASNGSACNLTGTLNRLLTIIPQLRSIYPQGILYDPQVVSKDQPIILNQTALGTAND